jgi:hypothetical protein
MKADEPRLSRHAAVVGDGGMKPSRFTGTVMTPRLWLGLVFNAAGWVVVVVRGSLPAAAFMLAASLCLVWAIVERRGRH